MGRVHRRKEHRPQRISEHLLFQGKDELMAAALRRQHRQRLLQAVESLDVPVGGKRNDYCETLIGIRMENLMYLSTLDSKLRSPVMSFVPFSTSQKKTLSW
jgi:hypothetical protein